MIRETRIVMFEKFKIEPLNVNETLESLDRIIRNKIIGGETNVKIYLADRFLRNIKIRKALLENGFIIFDALQPRGNGYVSKTLIKKKWWNI